MKSKINVFDAANWGPWETFLLAGVLFIAIFSPAPANASHRDGHNYNPANDPSYGVPCPNIYNTSSYSQGSYSTYAQGSYSTYAQGSYYTQGQYYSQSQYYVQGDSFDFVLPISITTRRSFFTTMIDASFF